MHIDLYWLNKGQPDRTHGIDAWKAWDRRTGHMGRDRPVAWFRLWTVWTTYLESNDRPVDDRSSHRSHGIGTGWFLKSSARPGRRIVPVEEPLQGLAWHEH